MSLWNQPETDSLLLCELWPWTVVKVTHHQTFPHNYFCGKASEIRLWSVTLDWSQRNLLCQCTSLYYCISVPVCIIVSVHQSVLLCQCTSLYYCVSAPVCIILWQMTLKSRSRELIKLAKAIMGYVYYSPNTVESFLALWPCIQAGKHNSSSFP